MNLSRRDFLARSAVVAGGLYGLSGRLSARASTHPFGIQLYTVSEALKKDVPGTLRTLQKIGYREVETAGLGGLSARDFRRHLDHAGLTCIGCHLDFSGDDYSALFDDAHTLGARYVVSSMLVDLKGVRTAADAFARIDSVDRDAFEKLIDKANRIGEQAAQHDLKYAYHNHNFEFKTFGGSESLYDLMIAKTDPERVSLEIDCGWMRMAGVDPIRYLKAQGKRVRLLHLKDYVRESGPSTRVDGHQTTQLGAGFIDYGPILRSAQGAGVEHYFVEQEPPFLGPDPLEAARRSFQYLHAIH